MPTQTNPTTPESRAKELARKIDDYLDENFCAQRLVNDDIEGIAAIIAEALRRAENDKLEEAARFVEMNGPCDATSIRSLKSKD